MAEVKKLLASYVLGPMGAQRVRVTQSLLAWLIYVLFAAAQQVGVWMGLLDRHASMRLSVVGLSVATLFVLAIRSGWSRRLADPSMTLWQCLFGLLALAWAYSIAGPVRGVLLSTPMVILMFAMFKLRTRQAAALMAGSMLLFACVMAWLVAHDPVRHDPRVELMHLTFAAIMLGSLWVLSLRMTRLQLRLMVQRSDLTEALERIRQLATRDDLTGLPNRRAMMDGLVTETARQQRMNQPLALALIDLDHFKRINDACGHQVGDAVLRGFAARAQAELRAQDVMSRWGGEEFLLLLPDTTQAQAQACVERLRERLVLTPFDEVHSGLRLTFSAGITSCQGAGDIHAAIERADQAMYRAKAAGRDRTELA